MTFKKIINVVGRNNLVNAACEDIMNAYSLSQTFKNKIITTASNPTTIHHLKPFLNWYSNRENILPLVILNGFPSTSYSNLMELNEYIMKESNYTFNTTNVIACDDELYDEISDSILKTKPYYNEIYPVNGTLKYRMDILQNIINEK